MAKIFFLSFFLFYFLTKKIFNSVGVELDIRNGVYCEPHFFFFFQKLSMKM